METRCGNCDAKLRVPDEKLKGPGPYRALCPMCKKEVRLEPESGGGTKETVSPEKSPPSERGGASGGWAGLSPLGNLRGNRASLLLEADPHQLAPIRQASEALGYQPVNAENTRDAMGKMRFHHFDLIVLSDRFDDSAWEESPVLNYLNTMSMSVRRRMFVALIGDDLKTLDPMTAFSLSADVVIGRNDAGNLQRILEECIAEKDKFYSVFMETLAETGRA
jgi:hypothetical protein